MKFLVLVSVSSFLSLDLVSRFLVSAVAVTDDWRHSVCLVGTNTVSQIEQQVMISDETDTHRTIQQLCERIHQLEAVS